MRQPLKLLVPFSVSNFSKLAFSILADQFLCCGVISVEKVSLEDLVGYNFYCESGCPPLPYLLDIEVEVGGYEPIKA